MRVAVVGAGIAGLSAAWELRGRAEVTVFDPNPPGGKVRTTEFEGHRVDEGPDAFITRTPDGLSLCAELGLASDLVYPAAGRTLLWHGGRLTPLPEGLMLGVPGRLRPLATSGLLTPVELARAGLDLVLPRTSIGEDIGAGELLRARFGPGVTEKVVEPLLGGIHATGLDDLSLAATAPQILAVARKSRSLLLGLRRAAPGRAAPTSPAGPTSQAASKPAPSMFATPRQGLSALVDRLASRLANDGVAFSRTAVEAVSAAASGVDVDGASFDGAVLAVAAPAAARLLGDAAPAGLGGIELTSVVLVTFAFTASELPSPPGINGFLVPQRDGRLLTAASFGSNKWPHWADEGTTILRVSTGRRGDERAVDLDDDQLVSRLTDEVNEAMGTHATAKAARVSRWPASFPHYRTGHMQLVDRFDRDVNRSTHGRVTLAGSSYRGAGIPACIGSGRLAATRLVEGNKD